MEDILTKSSINYTSDRIEKKYTVLSLDGGGVRGVMTAQILAEIEKKIRKEYKLSDFKITDAVDCVIGTSAGGLLALALAAGYSAIELCEPFEGSNKSEASTYPETYVSTIEEIINDTFEDASWSIANLTNNSKYK